MNPLGLRTAHPNQLPLAPAPLTLSKHVKTYPKSLPSSQSQDDCGHKVKENHPEDLPKHDQYLKTESDGAGFHLATKLCQIGDVDSCGGQSDRSCQQVSCYAKHIFSYLQELELSRLITIRLDFLQCPVRLEVTPRMRHILFDWLVQVHGRFNLQPETLYLTFHIVDRYLASVEGRQAKKSNFQLLGVSALFLASKYEEVLAPSIHDIASVTSFSCSKRDVRSMERCLLLQLDFRLGCPAPIQFLRRYAKVAGASRQRHELAKYVAEIGCLAYQLAHLPPSGLAAAAFRLAGELLRPLGPEGPRPDEVGGGWSDALEVYSGYSAACLLPAVRVLASAVVRAASDTRHSAVRKKYSSGAFLMISTLPDLCATNPLLRMYTAAD